MSEEASTTRHVHFHNLDVLRFFAAFMIVIVHGYGAILGWEGLPEPLRLVPSHVVSSVENLNGTGLFLHRLINNLDLGVEFFFLISGFLITYLMLKEREVSGKLDIPKFYMRRLLRIWPLYFLVIAITPVLANWTDSAHPNYIWNLLFGNNYLTIIQKSYEPGLAHLWSICVEEHFYLIWPILLFFVPVKKLPILFSSLIFLAILSRWYYFETSPEWLNHTKLNTICRMDTLAIGGWIARVIHQKPVQIAVQGWIRALVYLMLILLLCFDDTHQTDSFFLVAFKRLVYTSFFSFLLLNYLFNPAAWMNFKKKNILHYLGKISFGIYMYHNILFPALFQKIIWRYQLQGFWLFWFLYIAAVLVISVMSYELFEKQFLKLKDRFAIVRTER